ncbi:hypothetical protein MNBD_GAMMA22-2531 [hydrothermal vent metagenome]|uniref:Glycosyltransferase n=1 Tax=hydrothermal vent metagenome TaxID=652676 RepID=A0A3B0ZEY9_9ZZZZ
MNTQLPLVVHIIDRLPADGAERLLVDVLKNRSINFRFMVLCLVEGGALVAELEENGIPVIIFDKSSKYDLRILFKLIFWLRKQKPTIVHTHLFTADTWGRLAAFIVRVPGIVNTVHSTNTWMGTVHRIIDKSLSYITDRVIACSQEVANVLVNTFNIANKRILVVANGIDFQRFETVNSTRIKEIDSLSDEIIKIVIIGRLHPAKGHLDLIKAITELKSSHSDFHVFFVGEGELQQEIIEKCNENDISDYITLMGQRSDIPSILAKVDIFVMPSHWEGLPMALLEAMAMSKPVIASRVGGIPDVISDGVNGLLINKCDYLSLKNAFQKLLPDTELRNKLGKEAKKTVLEKYSAKNVSQQYELLYQKIIESHK